MATIPEALTIALQHHRAGQLQTAEQIYRKIIEADASQGDAWHLLGVLAHQTGRHDVAARYIEQALERMGDVPEVHLNLAKVYGALGRMPEAVAAYRRVIELAPECAEAYNNMGNCLAGLGQSDEAMASYRRALEIDPQFAEAINNLGNVLAERGASAEATICFRRATEMRGDFLAPHRSLGLLLRKEGKLEEAAASLRRAAELDPNGAQICSHLGDLSMELSLVDDAIGWYRRALAAKGDLAELHNNLGLALKARGRLSEAAASYRRALGLKPEFADAHNNLGLALAEQGESIGAMGCFRRALELEPSHPVAWNNLGNAHKAQGMPEEALACYQRATALNANFTAAQNNIGVVLMSLGQMDEAIKRFCHVLRLNPEYANAHNNLGYALERQGRYEEAIACFRRAIELDDGFASAHSNLGHALLLQGRLDEAASACRRALELDPKLAEVENNMGNICKDRGSLDEAIACFARATALDPKFAGAQSNLVYTQCFRPESTAQTLLEEACRWSRQHAEAFASAIGPFANERSPDRPLRIGYVSPDFREHCQAFFTMPLFSAHDRSKFEIVCYADLRSPDHITTRLSSYARLWRNITGLSDEEVARMVRDDRIDILVDLTMHMAHNRLSVLARKPAPIQVCWLAYPGTTGLSAIDYRLTDPYLDPPGLDDRYYSEESIRLPDSFWCYDPLESEVPVSALPAEQNGFVTFGCLNNFCKVNVPVLKLWARVLRAVECSRLILLAGQGSHRDATLKLLESEGVARARIHFVALQPRLRYLRTYHGIDLGLDTFPYNGHTTSLDSYWMGVPVVTLAGSTVVGRAGVSHLSNLGIPELIARNPDQYVQVATELAQDLRRLSRLRATLRERMQASPLMDARRFARNVEDAYRRMWRRWCVAEPAGTL